MRAPRAALEVGRHAGPLERVLEQAEVMRRGAHQDHHLVEGDAAARFPQDPTRDLHALTAFARRREELERAVTSARRRRRFGEQVRLDAVEIAARCRRHLLDHGPGGGPDTACLVVLRRSGGQDRARRARKRPREQLFDRRAEIEVEQDQWVGEHAIARHSLACDVEQPGPIGHLGLAELLLGLVDEMRQINVGRRVGAHLHVRGANAGKPDVGERASKRTREARCPCHVGEHRQPIVPRRLERRPRGHGLEGERAGWGNPAAGKPRCRDPRGELRQAEPGQADGGWARPRDRTREVVGGAARGGDDRQGL